MAQSKDMTTGDCLPLIFQFTVPLLLGNLLQQTYYLVDSAIVGHFLGINALAAVGASTSVVPLIFQFTVPLLLGNLLQQTYYLVDSAIVGHFLGINALAAVGASTSVVFLILGFCNGCCGGFGIPIAQKFGAKDYATMRKFVAVSLKLSGGMSVIIALVTSVVADSVFR